MTVSAILLVSILITSILFYPPSKQVSNNQNLVRITGLYITWVGRISNFQIIPENMTIPAGDSFNYSLSYAAEPFQYAIQSVNVTTLGFKVTGTSVSLPQSVYPGTYFQLIAYFRAPNSSFNGTLYLTVRTS